MVPRFARRSPPHPSSSAVYGIALRAWAAAGQPDSVRSAAERWAAIAPTEETPYREWGAAELGRQDRAGAQAAYLQGAQRLGRPDAMAAELAQLALAEGDYDGGASRMAARDAGGCRATAARRSRLWPRRPSGARPSCCGSSAASPI